MVENRLKSKEKRASQIVIMYTPQQIDGYDEKDDIYLDQKVHRTKYLSRRTY